MQCKRMSKKDFINMIDEEFDDDEEFNVYILNFDLKQKVSTSERVKKISITHMAKESKSILCSENKYLTQFDMHSIIQKDLTNIEPRGVMKTILVRN